MKARGQIESNTVKKSIQKGNIAPVYLLYGSQKFMMDELIAELSKRLLDEASIDFNFEQVDLNEQPLSIALEAAETLPFMAEKRLVVAREALFLTAAKAASKVEHDLQRFEQYLQNPVDYSVLVLTVDYDKLDERKKIVKLLKDTAQLCSCSPLTTEQLLPWLQEQAQQEQITLDSEAAHMLVQFAGQDMHHLANELQKMVAYVGLNGRITTEIVKLLIARSLEQDVFTMVEQAVHLRMQEAFSSLHELLKRREEPIKILFLLARQFRLIYRAKELERKGYSPQQMSKHLGLAPFICRLVLQQGALFTDQQLRTILSMLADTDYALKTGQVDKVLGLELFLLKVKDIHSTQKASNV